MYEIMRVMPLTLLFSSGLLWKFCFFLWFHINFRIICSSSGNNVRSNLMGIDLNLWIALGSRATLTKSSNPRAWDIFAFLWILFSFHFQCFKLLSMCLSPPWSDLFLSILIFLDAILKWTAFLLIFLC